MSTPSPSIAVITSPRIENFSIALPWLVKSEELRLDASFYNPRVAEALAILSRSGLALKRLEDVTEKIFIPPRFKRIYVDKDHGIPFLQGSHVVHFDPADIKSVSLAAHKAIETWIIHSGWVLATRSGTIGRVTIALPSWNGWAASEHIIRIIPSQSDCPAGYIYAYLSSELGQAQLTSQIYGAVVDEITEDQAKSILIPVPKTNAQRDQVAEINRMALAAMQQKDEAVKVARQAISEINGMVPELRSRAAARLEATFNELAQIWRTETGMFSVIQQKAAHPAYQRIIRIGKPALPLILKSLQTKPEHWLWALREISGEEVSAGMGDFKTAVAAWLAWGKKKGYL